MREKLTPKQSEIFEYLKEEIREKGYPPSIREICKASGLSSTSTVHAHLSNLEKKGYIHREPSKNRSIEILEDDFYSNKKDVAEVPIVGKVTAGIPIFAAENLEGTFPVPIEFVGDDICFMLNVSGDSMIDVGICDRDMVIVRKQGYADNGDIVIAMIEESTTVKTFYKEKDHYRLQPENEIYEPIILKEVVILGKVIGLFRNIR